MGNKPVFLASGGTYSYEIDYFHAAFYFQYLNEQKYQNEWEITTKKREAFLTKKR